MFFENIYIYNHLIKTIKIIKFAKKAMAAKEAGITKISHVDSYTTSYVWGIVAKQVTKVYGE